MEGYGDDEMVSPSQNEMQSPVTAPCHTYEHNQILKVDREACLCRTELVRSLRRPGFVETCNPATLLAEEWSSHGQTVKFLTASPDTDGRYKHIQRDDMITVEYPAQRNEGV